MMKFDLSKYDSVYVFSAAIGKRLHEFAKTSTSEEFASVIDELVVRAREEGIERERSTSDYEFMCEDDE